MASTVARMVSIQDLSCFGKSSITIALPVISAAGVEAVPLPTALLSTHTTGFEGYYFESLTAQMVQICEHWQKIDIRFDAVQVGYLAGEDQIAPVMRFADCFCGRNTPLIVDPVMGDGGKLYNGFPEDYPQKLLKLCQKADVLTPNVTEACLLSGTPYAGESNSSGYLDRVLQRLETLCPNAKIAITGVHGENGTIGTIALENGRRFDLWREHLPAPICGAGDLFAAVLSAMLVRGADFGSAIRDAQWFVGLCIRQTEPVLAEHPYGLRFEPCLGQLAARAEIYHR